MYPGKDELTAEYINTHDSAYAYLLRYFLPELSDPLFRQDAAEEIEQDERMTYCRYMAAWLPFQPHYSNKVLDLIERMYSVDHKA